MNANAARHRANIFHRNNPVYETVIERAITNAANKGDYSCYVEKALLNPEIRKKLINCGYVINDNPVSDRKDFYAEINWKI